MGSTWAEFSTDGNNRRADEGVKWAEGFSESRKDDEWYIALIDALEILGLRYNSVTTPEQDAFVLAYADEVATRPEHERD
jgi:hypothetical protein